MILWRFQYIKKTFLTQQKTLLHFSHSVNIPKYSNIPGYPFHTPGMYLILNMFIGHPECPLSINAKTASDPYVYILSYSPDTYQEIVLSLVYINLVLYLSQFFSMRGIIVSFHKICPYLSLAAYFSSSRLIPILSIILFIQ